MSLILVTESGEQHGLINTLANSCRDNGFQHMEPEWKKEAEKMKKEDNKKVKARYLNHRGNHERLSKPYCRWAGDPIQIWHFIPGYVYEIPMGLVTEVNSKRLPQRADLISRDGKNVTHDGKPVVKDSAGEQIHEFVPVSF
jgi:hypothetical protein